MNWQSKLHNIELLKESLKNINFVRNNESEIWRLYNVLKDLPLFKGWDRMDTVIAFSDSVIRVVGEDGKVESMFRGFNGKFEAMGDPTKYFKSRKILVVLKGFMRLGTKKDPKAANGRQPMIEQDCFPVYRDGGFHNVYFELNDGDYISPHALDFFNS